MTSTDVNETIVFRRGKLRLKYLAIGAGLVAVGILALLQIHKRETLYGAHDGGLTLAAWGALALGILCLLREAYRIYVPGEPLLTLTSKGLVINIDGITCVDIPWHEVVDLTTIDVNTRATLPINVDYSGVPENEMRETYRNVTAVAVSQDFYDRAISPAYTTMKRDRGPAIALGLVDGMVHHVAARSGLGSGWSSIFVRRGDEMLVALHHSMLPVSSNALRTAVEARWRAFGAARTTDDAAPARLGNPRGQE